MLKNVIVGENSVLTVIVSDSEACLLQTGNLLLLKEIILIS